MKMVLIKYDCRYEDVQEIIGIAINMDAANKYVEWLGTKWPDAYGKNHGTYLFEEYEAIDESTLFKE